MRELSADQDKRRRSEKKKRHRRVFSANDSSVRARCASETRPWNTRALFSVDFTAASEPAAAASLFPFQPPRTRDKRTGYTVTKTVALKLARPEAGFSRRYPKPWLARFSVSPRYYGGKRFVFRTRLKGGRFSRRETDRNETRTERSGDGSPRHR